MHPGVPAEVSFHWSAAAAILRRDCARVALVALALRLRRVVGAIGEISPHFFHVSRLFLKARERIQSFAAVLRFAKPPVHLGQDIIIRRRSSI